MTTRAAAAPNAGRHSGYHEVPRLLAARHRHPAAHPMAATPPLPRALPRRSRLAPHAAAAFLALAVAACGEPAPPADGAQGADALTGDSTLARDLTLLPGRDGSATLGDTLRADGAAPPRDSAPAVAERTPAGRDTGSPPAERAAERPAPPRATARRPAPARRAPTTVATTAPTAPSESADVAAARPAPTAAPDSPSSAPPTERATAPGAGRRTVGIASGAVLGFTTAARVCTTTNAPGDKIVATLDEAAAGANGFTLPAGTKAVLELTEVERDGEGNPTGLRFRVRNLDDGSSAYQAAGEVTTADTLRRTRANRNPAGDRRKVIGGAVVGAVLGQVLGKDTKGTVIGAAAGGAIGAAGAARGARYEACLPAGAKVTLRLSEPIVM